MRVLIADDVPWITKGVVTFLEEAYDVQPLIFDNGQSALEAALRERVDIMITDIKMPGLDGLELLAALRERGLDMPVIMLSGYGDFFYAQEAIRLGAIGYLLKPVDRNQLFEAVDKALDTIRSKRHASYMEQCHTRQSRDLQRWEIAPVLFRTLLRGEEWADAGQYKGGKALLLLHMAPEPEQQDWIPAALDNVICELLDEFQPILLPHPEIVRQYLLLLRHEDTTVLTDRLVRKTHLLFDNVTRVLGLTHSVGVSTIHEVLSDALYREAELAVARRLCTGKPGVYVYTPSHIPPPKESTALLKQTLGACQIARARELLNHMLTHMEAPEQAVPLLRLTAATLSQTLGKDMHEPFEALYALGAFQTSAELAQAADELLMSAAPETEEDPDIIPKVNRYLDEHFDENFTVQDLAMRFNVSYSHLSALFKKSTGVSVVQYITRLRMETAARMLAQTPVDVAAVASMVGYDDIQYFYRLFRKTYDDTPLGYRKKHRIVQ